VLFAFFNKFHLLKKNFFLKKRDGKGLPRKEHSLKSKNFVHSHDRHYIFLKSILKQQKGLVEQELFHRYSSKLGSHLPVYQKKKKKVV
jgi:hypothetical protein